MCLCLHGIDRRAGDSTSNVEKKNKHSSLQAGSNNMMQQRIKQEVFAKPGAPRPEELPSPHSKNTPACLSGQHFRLTPKSGHNPKAPGARLSAAPHRDEAEARLTPAFPTLECASQQMPLRSPVPDSENLPPRRPLKLAPLELPEVVRESQREKIRGLPQEATKAVSRKLVDTGGGNGPCPRKVKACARKGPAKAPACPSLMSSEPGKGLPPPPQQQQGAVAAPRARLARARPVELSGDPLEAVVCRGTPAPSKPAPPSLFPSVNANARTSSAARGAEVGTFPNASSLYQQQEPQQQEAGRRRPRLRRAERLEEDQGKSNTSTGGLSADESKVAQGLLQPRRGQQQQRTELGTLRLLEKASKRNPVPQQPGNMMEVSGRALRRIAVSDLQGARFIAVCNQNTV